MLVMQITGELERRRLGVKSEAVPADTSKMTPVRPAPPPTGLPEGERAGWITGWIPHGRTLPRNEWEARHRAVVWLLGLHAPVLVAYGLWRSAEPVALVACVVVPLGSVLLAASSAFNRQLRSGVTAVGLMVCSALVVFLSHGAIEAHFHFFVMIPVIALYEDWVPFGLGVAFVLLEHGLVGTTWPDVVYNHAHAQQHPWHWAGIHAGYVAFACLAGIVHWRVGEQARTAEQRLAGQLAHQAMHDELTGLANRQSLVQGGIAMLAAAELTGDRVAVLVLDLDRFKDVNDTLGHHHGDELLTHVSRSLRRWLRGIDRIARLGGDEFAVVIPRVGEEEALGVASRLRTALLNEHPTLAGVDIPIDASIGIALSDPAAVTGPDVPPDAPAPDDPDRHATGMARLLRQAEVAMYSAKRDRSGIAIYDAAEDAGTRGRLSLLADLRKAVDSEDIVLHFQPVIRLSDGALVGAEALIRWHHPVLGMVPPMEFIPLAETTNLIVPLTHRVMRLALAQVRAWLDSGLRVPVAVNISARSVTESDLTGLVQETLEDFGLPPSLLRLEITETTLVSDPSRAMRVLQSVHDLGVGVSLDDFGTGYSSLSYLKHLPVDELKIDRSFVSGLAAGAEDAVLVRATIELGHNLGMSVVAEGVENAETATALRDLGCDRAQGYHFARPLPPAAFSEWALNQRRALATA
jgi:diguanylate cyclase (GGDEF)-like protein